MALTYQDSIKQKLRRVYEYVTKPKYNLNEEVALLGKLHRSEQAFLADAKGRFYLTFRRGFLPTSKKITSDAGFGCMIRSGSMLVAEAMSRELFGRDFVYNPDIFPNCPRCVWFVSLFSEEVRKDTRHLHPFSIQHLIETGEKFRKKQGKWFAPGTIAFVYEYLLAKYAPPPLQLGVYLCPQGLNSVYIVCLSLFQSTGLLFFFQLS
jgi:hypothetical protein